MDEKTLKIESTRRLGQPKADMSRPRPLLIRFATEWDARKCLSKSYRLKNYERIFISQSLKKEDQATKRKLLQKRYEMINSDGVPRDEIKVNGLKLFRNGAEVIFQK